MRVVGIIGYKNSGKTSLLVNLAHELTARGHIISSVKHISCALDLPKTDTERHREFVHQVAAIAPEGSAIFFQDNMNLDNIFGYLRADFVLIEGFKEKKNFPKIVCLRSGDRPEMLLDGLELCAVGERPEHWRDMDVPFLDAKNDISKIADLVENKGFKLPNLNCGVCGYKTCYEMAVQIVEGSKTVNDCRSLTTNVQISIDDRIIYTKPFISDMLSRTIVGLLSSLKGYEEGKIEIKIDNKS